MAADRVQRHARRKLRVAVVEHHALGIIQPHDAAHVLDLERMGQARIAHVAPGGVGQLALLEMKPRFRKAVEIADMVVMQMGEDDVLDRIRIDAERGQRLDRTAQKCALALLRYLGVKAGIDDENVRPPPFATHTK